MLQAVFLRLLRRDRPADPVDNPESYLRRSAINASLDVIRSRQEAGSVQLDDSRPGSGDQTELRDSLRIALAALNPRAAEIFTLRTLEGYSNAEVARMLGMSAVHVAVLLHRTRKQLQKTLRSH